MIIEEQKQIIADLLLLVDVGIGSAPTQARARNDDKAGLTGTRKEQIKKLRDEGWTFTQIGKALNMDRANARALLMKKPKPPRICSCGEKAGYSGKCRECYRADLKFYCECGAPRSSTAKQCVPCSAKAKMKHHPKCSCGNEKNYRAEKCLQCFKKEKAASARGRVRHDKCPVCDKVKRKVSKTCVSCRRQSGASKPILVR
jgi:hypothetical protein